MSEKAYTRLITAGKGHKCKVCGEDTIIYADTRALEKHYLNRNAHSARQVIKARVLLEVISKEEAALQAVRNIHDQAEFIEPVEPEAEERAMDKQPKEKSLTSPVIELGFSSDYSMWGTMY